METLDLIFAVMLAFWSGAIVAMASGALFAYIVFRTKRDSHEPLFMMKGSGGGAYTSDPVDGDMIRTSDLYPPEPEPPEMPEITMEQNRRLLEMLNAQRIQNGDVPLFGTVTESAPVETGDKYDD